MFARIMRFVKYDIWNMRRAQIAPAWSLPLKLARVIVLSLRGFDEDKCVLRASALTFYTLLSIVPVLAMAFGVAKGFGFETLLERQLLERMQGQEEIARYIIGFSESMLDNTRGGMVAGVGIALLFWTVIKLLGNIETSFNAIWGVDRGRSLPRKCSDYMSAMLLCPLLLIMASGINVLISGRVHAVVEAVPLTDVVGPIVFTLLSLLPYCVMWALFTFLYMFMPNIRVRIGAALAGGLVAGILYQVLQMTYIGFQVGVAKYNAIYGGFAALPLFLVWLNLSWLIVLLGAEISFAFQHADTYEFEPACSSLSPGYRRLMSLWVMHALVQGFQKGTGPAGTDEISRRLHIPARLVRQILSELNACGMVTEAGTGAGAGGYQPAMDIAAITIASVIEALDNSGASTLPVHTDAELEELRQRLAQFRILVAESPANCALARL